MMPMKEAQLITPGPVQANFVLPLVQVESRPPAAVDPIAELAAGWQDLPTLDRVPRIKAIVDSGYSQRRLERLLGIDECTIRKYVALAHLTPQQRADLAAGKLKWERAVRLGRENLTAARKQAAQQRFKLDPVTLDSLADPLSDVLVAVLATRLSPPYDVQTLRSCRPHHPPAREWEVRINSMPQRVPNIPTLAEGREIFRNCRPERNQPDTAFEMTDYLVEWIFRFFRRVSPHMQIIDRAIQLALRKILNSPAYIYTQLYW